MMLYFIFDYALVVNCNFASQKPIHKKAVVIYQNFSLYCAYRQIKNSWHVVQMVLTMTQRKNILSMSLSNCTHVYNSQSA